MVIDWLEYEESHVHYCIKSNKNNSYVVAAHLAIVIARLHVARKITFYNLLLNAATLCEE